MKLIICRHGESDITSASGFDRDRKLSDKGKNDIAKMAKFIQGTPIKVTKVYHSPYLRTIETAQIYSDILPGKLVPETSEFLAPSANYNDLLPGFCRYPNSETILIVGHNPDVSYFAANLLKSDSIASMFFFSPGATLAINVARENFCNGQLVWFVAPDFLT